MAAARFDNNSRRKIREKLEEQRKERLAALGGEDRVLAEEIRCLTGVYYSSHTPLLDQEARVYYREPDRKPSQWFAQLEEKPWEREHGKILDAFVPKSYQASYLYMIDKLNQFPYSRGWNQRTVRTQGYGAQIYTAFELLGACDRLFWRELELENVISRTLSAETEDYMKSEESCFQPYLSYLYAAEIDLGNQAVIQALKEAMLNEDRAHRLDGHMILGILRSDNASLHQMVGSLLLAPRLEEGLRQTICENMDQGIAAAFLSLLKIIEENDLIRHTSVKRAVSSWIGIYSESSLDRVDKKAPRLMRMCLEDREFCREQLKSEDTAAVSAALWALGFTEAQDAAGAMTSLAAGGTRNQKLAASFYNQALPNTRLKRMTAKRVILEQGRDLELTACFLPAYLCSLAEELASLFQENDGQTGLYPESSCVRQPKKPCLASYFESREEAGALYSRFMEIYCALPKNGLVWEPSIFPWHKTELKAAPVIAELALTAYVLQDQEKITRTAELIKDMPAFQGQSCRGLLVNLLLNEPSNREQRELLVNYVGNQEEHTSFIAWELVKRLKLEDREYAILEDMLRYKRGSLRKRVIELLLRQEACLLEASLKRLIEDEREEKRAGALDMLMQLQKDKERQDLYEKVKDLPFAIHNPTDKERLLIKELTARKGRAGTLTRENGYGLYDPGVRPPAESIEPESDVLKKCLPLTEAEAAARLIKLDQLLAQHSGLEYMACTGEMTLLGNEYLPFEGLSRFHLDNYPLAHELREFYETEVQSFEALMELYALFFLSFTGPDFYLAGAGFYEGVWGRTPFKPEPVALKYKSLIHDILINYKMDYMDRAALFQESVHVIRALTPLASSENRILVYQSTGGTGRPFVDSGPINRLPLFELYFQGIGFWRTDEEFIDAFYASLELEEKCMLPKDGSRFLDIYEDSLTPIQVSWFIKAYLMELIPRDILVKSILEYTDAAKNLETMSLFVKGEGGGPVNRWDRIWLFGDEFCREMEEKGNAYMLEHTREGKLVRELYWEIAMTVVDEELRRGDSETPCSGFVKGVTYILGIQYLARILMALGKDKLDRSIYDSRHSGSGGGIFTKQENLSWLLQSCYPAEGEGANELRQALQGSGVDALRLVETAMCAPQWINIIQEYLGWQGLKSGCCFFIAHMNEGLGAREQAIIARYTPLSQAKLQAGAFDMRWFKEVHTQMGQEHFEALCRAARYCSDSQKYSRIIRFTDAASGKIDLAALKKEIYAKRSKDLLMSCALVPLREDREADMLERYEYFLQFLRESESRRSGAQRRSAEAKAVETAILNLSANAGYSDVTRLVLNMDARLGDQLKVHLEWRRIGDFQVRLQIGAKGVSSIQYSKNGKLLKSAPAPIGKAPYVLELKELNKKLGEQYEQIRKMLEKSMEEQIEFTAAEIAMFSRNPVAKASFKDLVFLCGDALGFIECGQGEGTEPSESMAGNALKSRDTAAVLISWNGRRTPLGQNRLLRIAHPLDLSRGHIWREYQRALFDRKIRQPFKQVFRELYVKPSGGMDQICSRMFAGSQMEPQKTAGLLRERGWAADDEKGLLKVFYNQDVAARICFAAGRFSAGEEETSVLEQVEFFHRRTFAPMPIGEAPDILYSEVMRDVELAVAAAAGGQEQAASHSVMEMRRVIVELNLPLKRLKNVILEENHALIKGAMADYTVHLGSGVVQIKGGDILNIQPVHSILRGRLFLPFVDEDPETAEIMSKIILLAEDKKIKDPLILEQINRPDANDLHNKTNI